jgi:hypothetical protein
MFVDWTGGELKCRLLCHAIMQSSLLHVTFYKENLYRMQVRTSSLGYWRIQFPWIIPHV